MYVKWFHEFDPYYGRPGKTGISFRFTDLDEWTGETAPRLMRDVEALRVLQAPQIPFPIQLLVQISESAIYGKPGPEILIALRERADRAGGILKIVTEPRDHLGSIDISGERIVVSLGRKTVTMHIDKGHPREHVFTKFPSDVLVCVALALDRAGHSAVASRVISECAGESSIIEKPEIALRIARCFARSQRVTEALQFSEDMVKRTGGEAGELLSVAALLQGTVLSAGEREYLRGFLTRRIDAAEKAGNQLKAAAAHYSLANHLRGSVPGDRRAIHHYLRAVDHDPCYWERPYFVREIAGVLFESGRYRLSACMYRQAITLGHEEETLALLADAVMFMGEYRQAAQLFEEHLSSSKRSWEANAEWHLKRWLLENIHAVLGIDSQRREPRKARALAKVLDGDELLATTKERLESALGHDALCELAWWNMGVLHGKLSANEAAVLSFTAAALIRKGNVDAWANAFGLAVGSDQERWLAAAIVTTACQLMGERFSAAVVRWAERQQPEFDRARFLQTFARITEAVPPRRQRATMRLLFDDRAFAAIEFGG